MTGADFIDRAASALQSQPVDGGLAYGTAGFRAEASRLAGAMTRVGALATLYSKSCGGQAVGVMVTASHNPERDNGAKVVAPDGAMLPEAWEAAAPAFANEADAAAALRALLARMALDASALAARPAKVVCGSDTRESSPALLECVMRGVEAVHPGAFEDIGCVTTPVLHFSVRARSRAEPCDLDAYYAMLRYEFGAMVPGGVGAVAPEVAVDCSCGVGSFALRRVQALVPRLRAVNAPAPALLNSMCGADYVQKSRAMPAIHDGKPGRPMEAPGPDALWASFDGDADRCVFFRQAPGPAPADGAPAGIVLADGDRIAVLVAQFVSKHLDGVGVDATIGVAQTAYSNGAATDCLYAIPHVETVVALTGVKHLEIAVRPYEIGVYWEPNGHGTVLFSDAFRDKLAALLAAEPAGVGVKESLRLLLSVSRLANQAVGDALADLLLVLAILALEKMTFDDWLAMYPARASANLVVRVDNKYVVKTDDCDRVCVGPAGLRDACAAVNAQDLRRTFVRPSGTEDVVRVYAEAPNGCEDEAMKICRDIAGAVHDFCGGTGDRP